MFRMSTRASMSVVGAGLAAGDAATTRSALRTIHAPASRVGARGSALARPRRNASGPGAPRGRPADGTRAGRSRTGAGLAARRWAFGRQPGIRVAHPTLSSIGQPMSVTSPYLEHAREALWRRDVFTFIPDRDLPAPPSTLAPGRGPALVFAGFPSDYSLGFLFALLQLDVRVVGIVTSPGAHPAILGDNALSRIAGHLGVPLLRAWRINDEHSRMSLAALHPDAVVMASFDQIVGHRALETRTIEGARGEGHPPARPYLPLPAASATGRRASRGTRDRPPARGGRWRPDRGPRRGDPFEGRDLSPIGPSGRTRPSTRSEGQPGACTRSGGAAGRRSPRTFFRRSSAAIRSPGSASSLRRRQREKS